MPNMPYFVEGNLTAKPKLEQSQGRDYAQFTIARDTRVRDASGNWVDGETEFIYATAFGNDARQMAKNFDRGDRIVAAGTYKVQPYVDDQGQTRVGAQLVAEHIGASTRFANVSIEKADLGRDRDVHASANTGPVAQAADRNSHQELS